MTGLREQALRVTYSDVGAVVDLLRKVMWTVRVFPGQPVGKQAATERDCQLTGSKPCRSGRCAVT